MRSRGFQEDQRFNQYWFYLTVVGSVIVMVYAIGMELSHVNSLNDLGSKEQVGIIVCGVSILIILSLFFIRLKTEIDAEGVKFNFWPFIPRRSYTWDDIDSIQVESYSPLGEFFGWGIRYNGRAWAYSVRGSFGIKIRLRNGKRLLIGTQKPEEAKQVIEDLRF